jgi:hypothetical protein
MKYIYDIETYINYFAVVFKNVTSKEINEFIIFQERNDYNKLINFLNQPDLWLIGYNNLHFDNQILHFLYNNQLENNSSTHITYLIYNLAAKLISEKEDKRYYYNYPFTSIDLMHVGNLFKSLKLVGVNLKHHLVKDLPYEWNTSIDNTMLQTMHDYNLNDVEITEKLFWKLITDIKVRKEAEDIYNVSLLSESNSGMANRIMENMYSIASGLSKKDFKKLRTKREVIHFRNVIFNDIYFETPELKTLLAEIKEHIYYKNQKWFNKIVTFDNIKYKLGIGGIHSVDKGDIFESTDEYDIIDCDIQSMYPSIIINSNIYPAHLSEIFVQEYKKIRDNRLIAKKERRETESYVMKILLNSVYGKFRHEDHWLYDPLCALKVTMNGQLYILMLIESLVKHNFKIISANTDGIITIVPHLRYNEYEMVLKEWCEYTNFTLDESIYKTYIRKDVNNYIALYKDEKKEPKSKGIFLLDDNLMKGWDKPIITIALRNYFLNNITPADTILNHKDVHDFCIAKKIDDKFINEFHYVKDGEVHIDKLQKTIRYYISKNGGTLYKYDEKEDAYINYCAGKRITIFNEYIFHENMDDYNIDYNYYISETQKIIDLIKDPQLKLF